MKHQRKRLSIVEYGRPVALIADIASASGMDHAWAKALVVDAGNRVASNLGMRYNPINVDGNGARAVDFAGLIRLAPSVELEVIPKFLGVDAANPVWREDFFFLATLSRHGHLLASEQMSTSGGAPRDLATLVARSITSMYEARKRRPLRSYRITRERDFFLAGDSDPLDLFFPSSEGFEQDVVRLDRRNGWNSDIVAAAKELLSEVSDPSVAGKLVRLVEELSPQQAPSIRRRPIPARHKAWRPLHELSVDVLSGLGLNYTPGSMHAPGYVLTTWRVWEDLLAVALRLGFGRSAVMPQKGFRLGVRQKTSTGKARRLSVFPDCVVSPGGTCPQILVDAKYKGNVDTGRPRISEADVYEALAFCKAAACSHVVLAYPALSGGNARPVGECQLFEKISVDAVEIVGIHIESRGISAVGGLRAFALNVATSIRNLFC